MIRVDETPQIEGGALYRYLASLARAINKLARDTMPIAAHSSAITADALVKTGQCVYRGFTVTTATAVAAIDIRDGTSAGGGTVIDTIPAATAAGTRVEKVIGVGCDSGLYADYAAGATGTIIVHFEVI